MPPAFRDAVVVEGVRPAASIATRTSLGAESIARAPGRAGSAAAAGRRRHAARLGHGGQRPAAQPRRRRRLPLRRRRRAGLRAARSDVGAGARRRRPSTPDCRDRLRAARVRLQVRRRDRRPYARGDRAVARVRGDRRRGATPRPPSGGSAGGPMGSVATLWLQASGQRSSRFLDPVHPDNLHNEGGSLTTAGQLTAGSGARDRIRRAGAEVARASTCRTPTSRKKPDRRQRQRVGQGGRDRVVAARLVGATVSQIAGYARRDRSRLDPSDADTPLTAEADRRLTRIGAARARHASGRRVTWSRPAAKSSQLRLDEALRLRRHRRGGGRGGRPERGGAGLRPRLAIPFRRDGRGRRCSRPTCRTRGRRRRR